jgi:hypothetical protein
LTLTEWQELGCSHLVDLMALDPANRFGFGDCDDVAVCAILSASDQHPCLLTVPSLRWMMPRMPGMLDTLWPPVILPSLSLMSPVGRSTTSVGASGEEGEEKA